MEMKFSSDDLMEALGITQTVINEVRSGKLGSKVVLDNAIWAVGTFHSLRPDNDLPVMAGALSDDLNECCGQLEELLPATKAMEGGEEGLAKAINPLVIYQIGSLLFKVVQLWMTNRS